MQYFDKYADAGITKLKNLQRSIKDLKEDVKSQIFTEFKGLDTFEARTGQKLESLEPTLIEACTVVDALTDDIRNELITMFSQQQLSLFKMIKEVHTIHFLNAIFTTYICTTIFYRITWKI